MNRLSLMLLLFPFLIFASDSSQIEFLGFTPDGKVAGVLEYGTYDGSGFPWAKVNFIDVKKNDFLGKEIKVELDSGDEKSSEELAKTKALFLSEKEREKLRIGSFQKSGIAASLTKEITMTGKAYTVSLFSKKTSPGKLNCPEPFKPELLKVILIESGKEVLSLQDDKKIPSSRGCAFGYRLTNIFVMEKSFVVFVQFSRPGFEGNDNRFLAITGMVP